MLCSNTIPQQTQHRIAGMILHWYHLLFEKHRLQKVKQHQMEEKHFQ